MNSGADTLFRIAGLPDSGEHDQQLTDLLLDVYVGGGFTERDWAENAFRVEAVRKRGEIFIAETDGELLGTAVLVRSGNELRQIAKAGEAEIHLVAVKSSARRKGAAEALLHACEKRALELGVNSLVLSTQASMVAAQRLYEKLGFRRNPDRDWSKDNNRSYMAYEKKLVD